MGGGGGRGTRERLCRVLRLCEEASERPARTGEAPNAGQVVSFSASVFPVTRMEATD